MARACSGRQSGSRPSHTALRHPVMRVLLHDSLFLGEGFARKDPCRSTLLREVALFADASTMRRRAGQQEARHRLRLLRRDDEILPVRLYLFYT